MTRTIRREDRPPSGEPQGQPRRFRFGLAAPLIVFASMALLFAYALSSGDPSKLPSALIGKPVPKFDLASVEGLSDGGTPVPGFSAMQLGRGDVSVVNFWASWCGPCVQEHPLLVELQRRGVSVYGVNYKDQAAAARRFLGRYGNPFAAIGVDPNGRTAIDWGVYGMPETFVVDGSGVIVFKHVGPLTTEAVEQKLMPAIASARAKPSRPAS